VVGQRKLTGRIRSELAVTFHRIQAAGQYALGFGTDLQDACEGAAIERPLGIAEYAENLFAAWNGMSWLLQIVFLSCLGRGPGKNAGRAMLAGLTP
jgi:hypothetical protein